METSYWLLRRLRGQWACGEAGLPWARGIASWPARALLSRRGHRRGPWLQFAPCPHWLCGCCAPRTAAIPAYSPSTWRQCGEWVGERVRGVAERGVDRYPSQVPAGRGASPRRRGVAGLRGTGVHVEMRTPGRERCSATAVMRRGLPFPDPSGSRGCCSLMKSASRLAPRVPTSLLPGGCGSQDAPA